MGVGALSFSPAVFLDRDGVINRNVVNPSTGQWESPLTVDELSLLPRVPAALRLLREAGFLLILVSNQPNFAKGKSSLEELDAIHQKLLEMLRREGVAFTACYYCLHHPNGIRAEYSVPCCCRKPSPYFLFRARDEFEVDIELSWMVGDRATDIECGHAAGVRTIQILNPEESMSVAAKKIVPTFQVNDLFSAASIIVHSTIAE